jgi:hypothetical protein
MTPSTSSGIDQEGKPPSNFGGRQSQGGGEPAGHHGYTPAAVQRDFPGHDLGRTT